MSWRLFKKILLPVIRVRYSEQLSIFPICRYSSSNLLIIKKIGVITCIGLNRPDSKNRFSVNLTKKLKEAVESFEEDELSPVAVLYGERGNFSYGYDVSEFHENSKYFNEIEDIALLETFTSKPIVAAISGFAVGLAFDIALWCDFRIVEETAVMGGYARKFGVPISDAVAKRLCYNLGVNKALDLMLTGRVLKSKEALESGIATRVVACGTGLGQAVNFANSLANMPQACLKADRAAILSFSKKYSTEHVKDIIMQIKCTQKQIALEEAEKGLYITESEDVRKKDS
ncbi:unnamed protein product [Nezara viridula]|uniref:Enoyl-CoA hydratase n=1 Tax=Nezara viridula TaxID=85310 RepID=A0A9P0MRX6_NEZVI|nr:unnamed protein product [Nezara viridula]